MVTISLQSSSGATVYLQIKDDLSTQADGYNMVFTTTEEYVPGSIIVFQSGLAMLDGYTNDFLETGPKEITWVNNVIGAPSANSSIWAYYRKKTLTI